MRKYVKKNHKFWNMKKINKHSRTIWYYLIVAMTLFVLWAVINKWANRDPLVSPICPAGFGQVQASEIIPCEKGPKEYLECQVYQGKITWADHEKLFRIVNECENKSWNPNATLVNIHKDGSTSTDRGIFMINDRYHKKLTNDQAFNFKTNVDYAISLYKKSGTSPWVCARILNIK